MIREGNQALVRNRGNRLTELEMKDVNWLDTENENEESAKNNVCFYTERQGELFTLLWIQ